MTDTIAIGALQITRIPELADAGNAAPERLVPEVPAEAWARLGRDFYDHDGGLVRMVLQSWLIRDGETTILVDTGAGNAKRRPVSAAYGGLDTPYLETLAAAGVEPNDVDVVINTHLHVDHVGWNTRLDGGEWTPTFPNAVYLLPEADFARGPVGGDAFFEDSVLPVCAAGLVTVWTRFHEVTDSVRMESAPGHTPGSSVVRLSSDGNTALFLGDVIHSPAQLAAPDANSVYCEDPPTATATRRRLLAEAAERDTTIFPAHFGGHAACRIQETGGGYAVREWSPLGGFSDTHGTCQRAGRR